MIIRNRKHYYGEIEDMIRTVDASGSHWFDQKTMIFFGSRIESPHLLPGDVFITSEKNYNGTQRLYTVRRWNRENNDIEDISGFNQFPGYKSAIGWIANNL